LIEISNSSAKQARKAGTGHQKGPIRGHGRGIQQKDHIRSRLSPMKDVVFFDSTTHPLGDPELAVSPRRRR
jgi:hypothetical protein